MMPGSIVDCLYDCQASLWRAIMVKRRGGWECRGQRRRKSGCGVHGVGGGWEEKVQRTSLPLLPLRFCPNNRMRWTRLEQLTFKMNKNAPVANTGLTPGRWHNKILCRVATHAPKTQILQIFFTTATKQNRSIMRGEGSIYHATLKVRQ